jgi:RNA polymerase sigma-70 factor (ECF subfamily)
LILLILTFGTEGEKNKFEYIYAKYKRLLYSKAYGILRDHMMAEDAVSEAMLRVYKNLGKIGDPDGGKSVAFVVTIVKNVSLTMLKRKNSNVTELLQDNSQDDFELESDVVSRMSAGEIYCMLKKVNEEYRNVFLLKYAYDMSNKEIGKMMGISPNNVGVLLHRAKKKISVLRKRRGCI